MIQADFSAWSLYTGPSDVKNIINDDSCTWVVGQWDGINRNTSRKEVKKDIDYRIDVVLSAFQKMFPHFKTPNRYFVIPEFFFHCAEGPYPYIKVDGKNYPFEYIVLEIKEKLKKCIPKDNNQYTMIIGSVLTSNVTHFNRFLKSRNVLQRQNQLNEILWEHDVHRTFKKHNHRR